jgi:hypothetical protein
LKAAGGNPPSIVYAVSVSLPGTPRKWASRYGFAPDKASASAAANAALDEMYEIWHDADAWREKLTGGMSEDEVEAMMDNPEVRRDQQAAVWIGPSLDGRTPGYGEGWVN